MGGVAGLRQVFRAQTSSALLWIVTLWNSACGTARGTPAAVRLAPSGEIVKFGEVGKG